MKNEDYFSRMLIMQNKFFDSLNGKKGFIVDRDISWGSEKIEYPIGIKINNSLIAIIEICPDVDFHANRLKEREDYAFNNTSINLFVCFDCATNRYLISERKEDGSIATQYKYIEDENIDGVIEEIKKIDIKKLNITNNPNSNNLEGKSELIFFKSTEKLLDPEWCRNQLGEVHNEDSNSKKNEICRFSTLDSLFCTIQYKTMRMNGLPGMNDKGEGLFAWDMIYKTEKISNEEYRSRKSQINNAFIVSFSKGELADDLTQWRLYGDDAKGVCCVYSIDKERMKDRFFLHEVRYLSYAYENPNDKLIEMFREHVKTNQKLGYYDLSPAIFFYKPNSFDTEKEVRLLVDNKVTTAYKIPPFERKWLLTNSNNIPNPYIDVPLKSIPLKMEKIILGPNMADADTVQIQLETMLEQQGMSNVKVELSSIKSYRNPTN